jgi:beta-galactosidase
MHAGLNTPDNQLDLGGSEAAEVARELAALALTASTAPQAKVEARVALIFDYEAKWLFEVQPQGRDFQYGRIVFDYYSALRSLGLDVDVIPASAALDGYALIVVPPLPVMPDSLPARLQASGAQVIVGPRSGSKTASVRIPDNLPPGPLAEQLPMRVWRVESLRPNIGVPVALGAVQGSGQLQGNGQCWRDLVEPRDGTEVVAAFDDGHPAIVRNGRLHYLTTLFDASFTLAYFQRVAKAAGLDTQRLPDHLRISRRGELTYVFNYGDAAVTAALPVDAQFVVGSQSVPPQGVSVYRQAPAQ